MRIDRTKCALCNEPKTSALHDVTSEQLLIGAHEFVSPKGSAGPVVGVHWLVGGSIILVMIILTIIFN